MSGCVDGWVIDEWVGESVDGWIGAWMNGWVNNHV